MPVTELYGFAGSDLTGARSIVEHQLGIDLLLHDSLYWGGDYFHGETCDGSVSATVRSNIDLLFDPKSDPPEERYAEPAFREFPVLIQLIIRDGAEATPAPLEGVAGIQLLRRERG